MTKKMQAAQDAKERGIERQIFNMALRKLLYMEGDKFVPEDAGRGASKFGITQASYPSVDIEGLSAKEAGEIYLRDWWMRYGYNRMPMHIGEIVFWAAVNVGNIQATKFLQRALLSVGRELEDDGIVGPITMDAVRGSNIQQILVGYRCEQAGFYRLLAAVDPGRAKYLKGWLVRAYGPSFIDPNVLPAMKVEDESTIDNHQVVGTPTLSSD